MLADMIRLEKPILARENRQFFNQKAIETLALVLGFDSQPGMKFWRQAQENTTGIWLIGFPTGFGASFKIKIDRRLKSVTNLIKRVAVERDDVIDGGDTANLAIIRRAIFYSSGVAAISHGLHGVTTNLSKFSSDFHLALIGFLAGMWAGKSARWLSSES
jgi:hypothetical protein